MSNKRMDQFCHEEGSDVGSGSDACHVIYDDSNIASDRSENFLMTFRCAVWHIPQP